VSAIPQHKHAASEAAIALAALTRTDWNCWSNFAKKLLLLLLLLLDVGLLVLVAASPATAPIGGAAVSGVDI
jgi:hypothetical protein